MSIIIQKKINADSNTVFKAITTKKGYEGWWARVCDVNCNLNQQSSIRFEKEDLTEEMCFRTQEVKENEKLVWLCFANNVFPSWIGTTLTFEIDKSEKGSHLKFIQKSTDPKWNKTPDYQPSVAGWDFFFESLKNYCETGVGQPFTGIA